MEQLPDDGAHWVWSLVPIGAALLAASLTLWGDHWRQSRLGRRIRSAEEVRTRLYEFLAAVAEYWMADKRDPVLEAKVLATKLIVIAELDHMRRHSPQLQRWFRDTQECRLDMIDAATGGRFQQRDWAPVPNRVTIVAREMGRIIRSLRDAC